MSDSDYDSDSDSDSDSATSGTGAPEEAVPLFGAISLIGRRSSMEDAISVWPNLCSPYINQHRPIDFFAVYDGHGGPHVAGLCRERMYLMLLEELLMTNTVITGSSSNNNNDNIFTRLFQRQLERESVKETWKRVLKSCFEKIDEMAFDTCYECGIGVPCGCPPQHYGLGGSTALLTILTGKTIIVANCGDSRAVLCRGGRAIPLSIDHTPDRPEERARIEACGGHVVYDDCARVLGILAISRAIGAKYLKKYIISEPEFTFTKREAEDEFLILASDGLWNVVSNDDACQVARECLQKEKPFGRGEVFSSPSNAAAALLTRLAMGRGSQDNISVIVVDLKIDYIEV
ncbi:probable protein phosphatase 2C 75 [Solanum pennellii]|uniref:protein-serine/threonine phosphatase n=1 Tax=Solanum pennellii TaxID=28526 RepID=A0ABM1GD55_SOLPN|nr:probable protein phosphatase 2C 75 [Solanum pennellii]